MLENNSRIELVKPAFVPGQNDLYNTNSQKMQLCRTKYGGFSEKKLMRQLILAIRKNSPKPVASCLWRI